MALRVDFERLMRERFLAGDDAAFVDYAAIDNDPALDDLALRGARGRGIGSFDWLLIFPVLQTVDRDLEDAYFDDDDGYD